MAFELHLVATDEVFNLKHPIRSLQYVTFNPYPVIWFIESQTGTPAVMEAWGGLEFYRDESDTLMIAVETEGNLTLQQLQEILKFDRPRDGT